jgi:hypothetical protein
MPKNKVTMSVNGREAVDITKALDDTDRATLVAEKVSEKAAFLIGQNAPIILHDLRRAGADNEEGLGEIPVTVNLTFCSAGRKLTVYADIAWKRTVKRTDTTDPIIINPDQCELPLQEG